MKTIIMYQCEICGKLAKDKIEILECEASHYGLTVDEKIKWTNLKNELDYWSCVVKNTPNENTIKKYNEIHEEFVKFEKEHKLEGLITNEQTKNKKD